MAIAASEVQDGMLELADLSEQPTFDRSNERPEGRHLAKVLRQEVRARRSLSRCLGHTATPSATVGACFRISDAYRAVYSLTVRSTLKSVSISSRDRTYKPRFRTTSITARARLCASPIGTTAPIPVVWIGT